MDDDDATVVEGGISVTDKYLKWRINNFDWIFKDEALLEQQKMDFFVTDSNCVTTRWKARLDFEENISALGYSASTTSQPPPRLRIHLGLLKSEKGPKEVDAIVTINIEVKRNQKVSRKAVYKPGPGFNSKYEAGRSWRWKIDSLRKDGDIDDLISDDGSLTFAVSMRVLEGLINPSVGREISDLEEKLRWMQRDRVHEMIAQLENDSQHSDVKIVSRDGKEFFAYKWILCGTSEVFEAMFRLDMKEKKSGVVEFADMSGESTKILLHYIYTGKVAENWTKPGILEEIVYAADKFQIKQLRRYFDTALEKVCSVNNAGMLLVLANKTGLKRAEKEILKFVKQNAMDCDSFLDMAQNAATSDSVLNFIDKQHDTPNGAAIAVSERSGDQETVRGNFKNKKHPAQAHTDDRAQPTTTLVQRFYDIIMRRFRK